MPRPAPVNRSNDLLSILLLVWAALFLQACNREPRPAPLSPGAVVLAFGDSLTYGTGAAENESYPAVLAGIIGRRVVNAGVPGETSAEGLARLPLLLEKYRPSLVFLCHGGNDFLRHLDPESLRENLLGMIDLARASGAEVYLIAVPRPGLFLSPASLYGEIARDRHLPCEKEALSEILSDSRLKSDAIHPNAAGYARLAQILAGRVTASP